MSINSFGRSLRFTSWGESHGIAIGGSIDGCPPGIAISEGDIQPWLDKRRPGSSKFTTQRREPDKVRILSGVHEGRTLGSPIAFMIGNVDQRPKDYTAIESAYRPGHADYTYEAKYGIRDPRGGGRASARETASRVAAGAIARLLIPEVKIQAYLVELGGDAIDRSRFDADAIGSGPLACPDFEAARRWERLLLATRKDGNSLGGIVECVATGVPAGWGAPCYGKLDAELASAMMGINAVKGVEVGEGFESARLKGDQYADEMRSDDDGGVRFLSNHSGGILGGISSGQPIVVRAAFKPTPSIVKALRSVDTSGNEVEISTKGRHDPCVAIRGVPVVEAMMALVLADHKLLHQATIGAKRC